MLRAEELMIGDWVKTVSFKKESHQRVKVIYSRMVAPYIITTGTEEKWFLSELEPILLTPEILNKNDWVNDGIYATLFYTTDIAVEFYFHKGILSIYFNNELTYQSLPGINYVHTLQHHLKLCGIEKEIKL